MKSSQHPNIAKLNKDSISQNRTEVLWDFADNKYLWQISKETTHPLGPAINRIKRESASGWAFKE